MLSTVLQLKAVTNVIVKVF